MAAWLLAPAVLLQFMMAQWPTALPFFELVTLVTLICFMSYALWLYERQKSNHASLDWTAMMGGLLLFGWVGSYFLRLRGVETDAWQWTILALLATWFADSGAYMVGKFLAGKVIRPPSTLSSSQSQQNGGRVYRRHCFRHAIYHYCGILFAAPCPAASPGYRFIGLRGSVPWVIWACRS
ncbi:MAG: phosphatidate cytidylyltransferase [Chloroflexi bacterium]|nr:phosphatidate cytidylyltransferase [Chloroflexota bacterium]